MVSGTIRGAAEEAKDAVSGFAILCVVDIVCDNVNCRQAGSFLRLIGDGPNWCLCARLGSCSVRGTAHFANRIFIVKSVWAHDHQVVSSVGREAFESRGWKFTLKDRDEAQSLGGVGGAVMQVA